MVELPAGAGDPAASLLQGDFLDEVVESTLRSIVSKIKVEYRKELSKALEAANLDGTRSRSMSSGGFSDLAALTGPPAEAPPTSPGDESCSWLRSVGEAVEYPPTPEQPEEPAAAEPTPNVHGGEHGAGADDVECIGLGHAEGSRAESKAKLNTSESTDSMSKGVLLTVEDNEDLKEIRDAKNARPSAAERFAQKGCLRNSTYEFMMPRDEMSWTEKAAFNLISRPIFDFGMGCIIVFNAVTIGLETSITRQGDEIPAYLHILEYSFLVAYCIELSMRIHAVGLHKALICNWVKFDAVMVVAGVLNFIITVAALGGEAASVIDKVNMLKMMRLCRLARMMRVLVQFRTLWLLVQGFMHAALPMLWTAMLMLAVIYVFAVIAMETILDNPNAGAGYSEAARNFDSIGGTMITLMQFMTLDSVAAIYRPLISSNPWFLVYFLVFMLMGPIALMNIVTAILVESSLRTANEDQEAKKAWQKMRKKNMMPKLRSLFETLDTNGDGSVDLEELMGAPPDIKEAMEHIVGLDELQEIYNMLDYDGSGSIDIEEFVEGIMRSQADKPSEFILLVKQGRAVLEKLKDLGARTSEQQDDVTLPAGAMEGIKRVARRSSPDAWHPMLEC